MRRPTLCFGWIDGIGYRVNHETRERRLEALITDSAAGRPARPFRYGRSARREAER